MIMMIMGNVTIMTIRMIMMINSVYIRNIPAFKDGSNIVEDGASWSQIQKSEILKILDPAIQKVDLIQTPEKNVKLIIDESVHPQHPCLLQ